MKTYPIMLNLRGRRAVIVGGGEVGLRKLHALVEAAADVALVTDPEGKIDHELPSQVELICERYGPEMLEGAFLVVACTDDRELNARIAADARRTGAMVNVADDPEQCDFFLPAIARNGPVVIAVGTGGTAPGLAVKIRDQLAGEIPQDLGQFAELLGDLREKIKRQVHTRRDRTEINRQLADETTLDLFRTDGEAGVRKLSDRLIQQTVTDEKSCESSASE